MRLRCPRRLVVESLEKRRVLDAGSVVISEIMYHPLEGDAERVSGLKDRDFEFIEVMNSDNSPIELAGTTLSDVIDFTFQQLTLQPGQHTVVVHNRQAFEARYGTQISISGEYAGTLGNGGDRVVFADPSGNLFQDVTYDDAWYETTDGGGYSLTVRDPANGLLNPNLSSSWRSSSRVDGSPGFEDGDLDPRPRNVEVSTQSSRHLLLRWEPPRQIGSAFTAYRLFRDNQLIGSTTETSFLDTSVMPDRRYAYQVAIVHSNDNQFFSAPRFFDVEAIGGDLTFSDGTARGVVRINGLEELSGMSASRHNGNVFWTHNDGPQSSLYGINSQGKHVATLQLGNLPSTDWEDVAIGRGPSNETDYIYIGDIGGKDPKRNVVRVYRVPEPEVSEDDSGMVFHAVTVDVITLQYPSGEEFNSETLLSDPRTGDLYIIPKRGSGTPVFRAAAERLNTNGTALLELVGEIGFPNVSGGDISPSGNEIVIRNEDLAQLFSRADGQSIADALSQNDSQLVPVIGRPTEPNGEAITFDGKGRDYFTISEGESPVLYGFQRIPTALAGDANRDRRFDSSDLVQVFQAGKYETDVPALFSQGDWDGSGFFDSGDLVAAFRIGLYEQPAPAVEGVFANLNRNAFGAVRRHDEQREVEAADAHFDVVSWLCAMRVDEDFGRPFAQFWRIGLQRSRSLASDSDCQPSLISF